MVLLVYCIFIVHLFVLSAAYETTTLTENLIVQNDLVFLTQDFGQYGVSGPLNISLMHGLQPGAMISVLAKSKVRGTIYLTDHSDEITTVVVDARIGWYGQNKIILNTYLKHPCNGWCTEKNGRTMPVASDEKTVTTIIFEAKGFRVFINREEIAFYEHVTNISTYKLRIEQDKVYKVVYVTPNIL